MVLLRTCEFGNGIGEAVEPIIGPTGELGDIGIIRIDAPRRFERVERGLIFAALKMQVSEIQEQRNVMRGEAESTLSVLQSGTEIISVQFEMTGGGFRQGRAGQGLGIAR